jgi:hypothetical protein
MNSNHILFRESSTYIVEFPVNNVLFELADDFLQLIFREKVDIWLTA